MRLQLDIDDAGRSIRFRCGEHRLMPGQLAAALARAVETALLDQLLDAGPTIEIPDLPPEAAVRREALRMLDEDGLTAAQVCTRLGLSAGQLRRWDDGTDVEMERDAIVEGGY